MSDEATSLQQDSKVIEEEKRLAEARAKLTQKLKAKGAQSISYKEYLALQAKKEKAKAQKAKMPAPLKLILATPFILLACFGVFFIPFILFQIITGKSNNPDTQTSTSADTLPKTADSKSKK